MTIPIKDLQEGIQYISNNLYTKSGLFIGWLLEIFTFATLNSFLSEFISKNYRGIIYLIFVFIWFIYWVISREKYPKNHPKKIGLVVSVETEKNLKKSKILTDFTYRLRKIITEKGLDSLIEVIELNEHQARVTNQILKEYSSELVEFDKKGKYSDIEKVKKCATHLNKIGGHFYIWGSIFQRVDTVDKFFFELDGLVIHTPLDKNTHIKLTHEFINAWFRKISFEVLHFSKLEITSNLILVATRYIIGLAALISGDPEVAIGLHEPLYVDLKNEVGEERSKQVSYIQNRLRSLINEEAILIARWYIYSSNYEKAKIYVNKADKLIPNTYATFILKSVISFMDNKVEESLRNIKHAKQIATAPGSNITDQTWRFNYAFLLMWKGEYGNAIKQYDKVIKHKHLVDAITLKEVYQWNTQFPDFIPSFFINGYLKYKKSNNTPDALEPLETFLKKSEGISKMKYLRNISSNLIEEMKREMQIDTSTKTS